MENQEENQVESSESTASESAGQVKIPETSRPQESIVRTDPDSNFNYPIFGEVSAAVETQGDELVEPVQERRGFIKFLCAFIGTLISVVPFGAGVWSYLDPLAKRNKGGGGADGFIKVTTLDAISADGSPVKFSVIADKVDAWNRFSNVSIGAVYLQLVDGVPRALHTSCPHLGCFVDYRPGKKDFYCPCHNSRFRLDGGIVDGVSPRAMDALQIEVRNKMEVWVKYQNFQSGHGRPIPVS